MKKPSLFGMIALFLASVSYATDQDDSMRGMAGMEQGSMASEHANIHVDRTVTIDIVGMRFTPNHVDVKAGETIRFVIKNDSVLEHEFTLGDHAAQTMHRQEMRKAMRSGVSVHHHHEDNTVMVSAGQTETLVWTFARPGALEFDCNVPGHYEGGMTGTIMVIH